MRAHCSSPQTSPSPELVLAKAFLRVGEKLCLNGAGLAKVHNHRLNGAPRRLIASAQGLVLTVAYLDNMSATL